MLGAPGMVYGPGSLMTGAQSLNPHGLTANLVPTTLFAAAAPVPSAIPAHTLAFAPAAVSDVLAAAPRGAGVPASLETLQSFSAPNDGPRWVRGRGERFDGARSFAPGVADVRDERGPRGFIKNADGVWVGGRVADQSRWINQMHAQLSPVLNLSDVMDVMDDAYDESRVKLRSAEKAALAHKLEASSVHLEGTRNWVDAVLTDRNGRDIAVHTYRVYFHPGRGNRESEISEGIRRIGKSLDKAKRDFAPGGLAEADLQKTFAKVELNFDTRGYKEIEDYLRGREKEFHAEFPGRFSFGYVTEPGLSSRALRAEYNRLVEKFADQPEGLRAITDGVTYSRTVGVGHELNSHLKRLEMGLKITQAGRDFFGKRTLADGTVIEEYKTEFDAVTERADLAHKPLAEREVTLWEDKSTRVWLPLQDTMEQTFLYKLRIYRENRAMLEAALGAPLRVMFSVDVGGADRKAAKQGILVWKDPRQQELLEYLKVAGPQLSKEFGFPVGFIFVNSHPGETADLFNQEPMEMRDWLAMQQGGSKKSRRERKHDRKQRGR